MPDGLSARLRRWRPLLIALAAILAALSLVNASWLAPLPRGRLIVVANRGIGQTFDHDGADDSTCTARRIHADADNIYIENTLPSIYRAISLGADALALQVQRTRDGRIMVFHDSSLDCRTNGHGPVRDHSLAELKRLDVGYGYSPDGGRTFPLRGRGIGFMPTVEEVLREVPLSRIVFAFESRDPADADALVAAFRRAGVAIDGKYGFFGDPAVAARMRKLAPGAWVYDPRQAAACRRDYARIGWTSYVPPSCRNGTMIVPLDDRWMMWGWPYRFFDRMAKANTKVLIYGSDRNGILTGLEKPEQYGEVPVAFTGYLWVEDFYDMGPALRR
jgi:glycerophosphoryl diester phosphodiesterase